MRMLRVSNADIRQFGSVSVTCADHIMGAILALLADGSEVRTKEFQEQIRNARVNAQPFEYCLFSGAKLKVAYNPSVERCMISGVKLTGQNARTGFYVRGYASDGSDIMHGVAELVFGHALYRSARELEKVQLKGYYTIRNIHLGKGGHYSEP